MTIAEWIAANHLKCTVKSAAGNPNMRDAMAGSRHWTATFTTVARETAPVVIFYTTGPALQDAPKADEILDTVASDLSLIAEYEDAVELAVSLGETISTMEDVEQARETWRAIQKMRADLTALVGAEQIETLIYEIDRL